MNHLFEDVAVSPLVLLAVHNDRDIPGPHVGDVLPVLLVGVVELGELVALPVGGNVESGLELLAADQEDTTDDVVVVGTVNGLSTEEVLARSLQTSVETTDQVVGHEGELKLVVVLVVNAPQRVLVGLVVLPEPGKGNRAGVLVGVRALPVIEDESGLAESLKGVLGLGGGLVLLLSRSGSSGSGGSLLLGLLLLLGGSVGDGLLSEDGVLNNSLEERLVDNGLVPSGDGNVLGAPLLVQDESESAGQETGSVDISEGDTLANEVGVLGEVSLENGDVLQGNLGGLLNILLVVGVLADQGAVPSTEAGQELRVGIGQPAEDGSIVLLGLAQEGGLLVLGGN